jgi:hypothetical protein
MGGPGSGRHATGRAGLSNNKQYAKNSPRGKWNASEARARLKGGTRARKGRK